jgi:hypothetical protein
VVEVVPSARSDVPAPIAVRAAAAVAAVRTDLPVAVESEIPAALTDCSALLAAANEVCTAVVKSVEGIPPEGLE